MVFRADILKVLEIQEGRSVKVAGLRLDLGGLLLEHLWVHEGVLHVGIRVQLPRLGVQVLGHGLDDVGDLEGYSCQTTK